MTRVLDDPDVTDPIFASEINAEPANKPRTEKGSRFDNVAIEATILAAEIQADTIRRQQKEITTLRGSLAIADKRAAKRDDEIAGLTGAVGKLANVFAYHQYLLFPTLLSLFEEAKDLIVKVEGKEYRLFSLIEECDERPELLARAISDVLSASDDGEYPRHVCACGENACEGCNGTDLDDLYVLPERVRKVTRA